MRQGRGCNLRLRVESNTRLRDHFADPTPAFRQHAHHTLGGVQVILDFHFLAEGPRAAKPACARSQSSPRTTSVDPDARHPGRPLGPVRPMLSDSDDPRKDIGVCGSTCLVPPTTPRAPSPSSPGKWARPLQGCLPYRCSSPKSRSVPAETIFPQTHSNAARAAPWSILAKTGTMPRSLTVVPGERFASGNPRPVDSKSVGGRYHLQGT